MGVGCVICTEEFSAWQHSDKMSVVIKSCGHVFHDSCIKLWLKNSRTCPVCRQTTYDSPSYIGRVHLQRLSLDNTAVNNLLDESVEQKKKLEELEQKLKEKDAKLKTKDAELKKKENENKELNGKLHGICEYLNKISDGVKSIKCILHNPPVVEIKDDDHPITSSRAVINPRPSIIRSNRAPIPSSTAVSSRCEYYWNFNYLLR
ncbi:hypothetical protein ACKWTF_001139 [Chironomus riparius]